MKKFWLVVVLFALAYVAPLGMRPMFIPDEHRYAEIPREMVASGDWVSPHLAGVRYFEKTPLGYWINAWGISVFGENNFAVRFPSALAALLTALLVALLLRRVTQNPLLPTLGAAMYLTMGLVFGVGTFAVLDTFLTLFITLVLFCFYHAITTRSGQHRVIFLLLAGAAMGLSFLTKGFLALVVPALVIGPFLLWEKKWREFYRLPWLPVVAMLVVALPWCLMIQAREPDFWNYFFWEEHVRRFLSDKAQHPSPAWYFLPVLIAGALPWTVLVPAAVRGFFVTRGYERKGLSQVDPLIRFALCWVVFPLIFFSLSRGKLATYILPLFPAIVILMTYGLERCLQSGRNDHWFNRGAVLLAVVLLLGAGVLVAGQLLPVPLLNVYAGDVAAKWLALAGAIVVWAGLLFVAIKQRTLPGKLTLFALAPLAAFLVYPFVVPQQVLDQKSPDALLLANVDKVKSNMIVVSYEEPTRAACWFFGRTDVKVLHKADELEYGLKQPDAAGQFLTIPDFLNILQENAGRKVVVLVSEGGFYDARANTWPAPKQFDRRGNFIFALYY